MDRRNWGGLIMNMKSKLLVFLLILITVVFTGVMLTLNRCMMDVTSPQNQNIGAIKTPTEFKKDVWPIFNLSNEEKEELLKIAMDDERVKRLIGNKSFKIVQIAKFVKYPSGDDLGFANIYIRLNDSLEVYTVIIDTRNKTVKSIKSSYEAR